jgi:general secretion pathway protein K
LLIKGITPELYYGSEEKPGLSQNMTVYGMVAGEGTSFNWPGRININTAGIPVLAALVGAEQEEMLQALSDFRQEMAEGKDVHDFSSAKWYKEITGFGDVDIDPALITVSSDVFRIDSEASLNTFKTSVSAVVQRVQSPGSGKWSCKVLSWKTE